MKGRDVLAHKHRPCTLPIVGTVVWWMFLDRLAAPDWVWGATGVVVVVLWVAAIAGIWLDIERTPEWKP